MRQSRNLGATTPYTAEDDSEDLDCDDSEDLDCDDSEDLDCDDILQQRIEQLEGRT